MVCLGDCLKRVQYNGYGILVLKVLLAEIQEMHSIVVNSSANNGHH